jgi:hypothetical protein
MADNYKLVGKGIAAEDKNDNSKFLSVFLPESLPYHDGEINGSAAKVSRTIKNADGDEEEVKIFKKATVKAEWKKGSNDRIAPSVRKGETVNVYELMDTNIYYWEALGDGSHLRRKEKFSRVFNAFGESTETDTPQVKGNTYGVEVDTANGYLRIWTSADDKEKTAFDIDLNGGTGILTIMTTSKMVIQMNAVTDTILAENSKHTRVFIHENEVDIEAKTVNINADKTKVSKDLEVAGKVKCKRIEADSGKILAMGYHAGTHNN